MRTLIPLVLLLFTAVVRPSTASADLESCYDEGGFPAVVKLDVADHGLRAYLGGKFLGADSRAYPTLRHEEAGGWSHDVPAPCGEFGCFEESFPKSPVPLFHLDREEAVALRPELGDADKIEQTVGAWIQHGSRIWFGIAFYDGEGTSGVGGVGYFDPASGRMEIRRPPLLRKTSIDQIAYDGRSLWLGTVGHHECRGTPPTLGLVRYDWTTDRIETFQRTPDGPCGFLVHDLLVWNEDLWVATDLGISRRNTRSGQWHHLVPDTQLTPPMRFVTCPALYRELFTTLSRHAPPSGDGRPYDQFVSTLSRWHPEVAIAEIKRLSPDVWTCTDLWLLAKHTPSIDALQADLLAVRPLGSPDTTCLLKGFESTGGRDPAWRDFLIDIYAHADRDVEAAATAFDMLTEFHGDRVVAGLVLKGFLSQAEPVRETSLLPEFWGAKSIPLLIAGLDRFRATPQMIARLRIALVEATGYYLAEDEETIVPVPPGSTTYNWRGRYPTEEQWKAWWAKHKTELR